jgi:putative iron-regulated protein
MFVNQNKGLDMFRLFAVGFLLSSLSFASETDLQKSVKNYSALVHETYAEALDKALVLQASLHTFTQTPSVMTLEMARESWKLARAPYGKSEVFRFYNGPIDRDGGPEGLLNSWPLDEAYIDYVAGNPKAGVINNLETFPVISRELLTSLNELDGEKNISTGYHAIEFLLWGQDFFVDGPGQRSFEDYTTATNAGRRAEYLNLVADLLVDDLKVLESEWAPGADNFRKSFEALPVLDSMKKILSGMVFMIGDELAGERMYVAYDTKGQEDEHSCFSDMTHKDIQWNYEGFAHAMAATDLLNLPELKDTPVAKKLQDRLMKMPALLASIPVPFDQAIATEPGRGIILNSVEELEALARDLTDASKILKAPVDY